MANKIGCRAGRTKIVDPNLFDGVSSSNNIPVNNEDLTISVVLTTFRKGRTVLSASAKDGNTTDTSSDLVVNFINGSEINGKRVLTTNYTDLTMIGDDNTKDSAGEGLGITAINIDFNSSFAPMITIDFVDVRGSAIFQNEGNITSGKNKYSTFFQLPYPLFELTIKGYYGKPVKYCLHLTKFNAKFNSKTGNFEIKANFIGYTFAMLSDMLIGYLKAIPYTRIGGERYKEINDTRASIGLPPMLFLNELMIKISNINSALKKLPAKDEDANQLNNLEISNDILIAIENNLLTLGNEIDSMSLTDKSKLTKFEYVIQTEKKDITEFLKNIKSELLTNVKKFNENGVITLSEKIFELSYQFNDKSIKSLLEDNQSSVLYKDNTRAFAMVNYIKSNSYTLSENANFNIWDLTDIYIAIDVAKTGLKNNDKIAREGLAKTIANTISGVIGFDPTVRNIVEVFTTAVEVFMETIWTVSNAAELDGDGKRAIQLNTKFNNVKLQRSDLPPTNEVFKKQIHPWPDYREEDTELSYTEKYLGAKAVLPKPLDVQELDFIDDLLLAFLKAQEESEKAEVIINEVETNWFPVNPLDTRLFLNNEHPYSRISGVSREEVIKLFLIRGVTFLGYTNSLLSDKEIEVFADNEFKSIIANLSDDSNGLIKSSLGSLTLKEVIEAKFVVNGVERLMLSLGNTMGYTYTLMTDNNDVYTKVSPLAIDNSFGGVWPTTDVGLLNKKDTTNFLTNYNNNKTPNKFDDGGFYLKIFEVENDKLSLVESSADTTTNTMDLISLSADEINTIGNIKTAGFNPFGGEYGIQEFSKMNWGDPGKNYPDLPLMYVFYDGVDNDNGLGYSRKKSVTQTTDYDYKKNFKFISQLSIIDFFNLNETTTHNNLGDNRNNFNLLNDESVEIVYPYVNQKILDDKAYGYKYISLFGSRWYYGQDQGPEITPHADKAKALLFLNTLPWNKMPFEANEIKHLFDIRAGFIHAPKLWCAFVGGLLWRNSTLASGPTDPIQWYYQESLDNQVLLPITPGTTFNKPKRNQYINILDVGGTTTIKNYHDILLSMPRQTQSEFIRVFLEFVSGDWIEFKRKCEIISDGTINTFDSKLLIAYAAGFNNASHVKTIDRSVIRDNFINVDVYKIITPVSRNNNEGEGLNNEIPRQMFLEFDTTITGYNPSKDIIRMLTEEYLIANNNYKIWRKNTETAPQKYLPIIVKSSDMDLYINTLIAKFKENQNSLTPTIIKNQREQAIFNTSDEDVIKLQLYRTCKNTFDKWLGGSNNINDIIFQCGKTRNDKDKDLANFYRPNDTKTRLIDSFRFLDRSYGDIGDKLYINPTAVNDYLINSPNTSFYDAIGHLLSSNNFNFIALPTFINYNKDEELNAIFEPSPDYEKAIADGICGPTFICVYDGQKSKHLDFGDTEESNYTNDGIDFQCDKKNNIIGEIPADFSSFANARDNDVAVFSVNYSQQNQNIFKDITLDQSEFTETAESLQITDDISSKGAENNRSLAGQNIYNVYSVRSYKAEVEMMGNAMIQPMMHFQLNNIPMFHGGYLITRVKHSITPNNMSTSFTGVRIRFPKTKLLSGADFYMNMIDSLELSNTSGGASRATSASVNQIVNVLSKNLALNGDLNMVGNTGGLNKLTPVPNVSGILYTNASKSERVLLDEAVKPFEEMLKAWVKWMSDNEFAFPPSLGGKSYAAITSFYRELSKQKTLEESGSVGVAKAGTSNHGWGIAVDIKMFSKNGKQEFNINANTGSPKEYFNWETNPSYGWLMKNSYLYGWINPYQLRDGSGSVEEHWHFEYHGTSAKCLLDKNPKSYGNTVAVTGNTLSIVRNPKDSSGKEAIFNGCNEIYTKAGAGDSDVVNKNIKCPQTITGNVNSVTPKQLYDKIRKVNTELNSAVIAGIMGNLYHESAFNPEAYNKEKGGCGAYGIAQWRGARQINLQTFVTNKSLAINDIDGHIGFLFQELATLYKYTLSALRTVGPTEFDVATRYFLASYEMGNKGTLSKFDPQRYKTEEKFLVNAEGVGGFAYPERLNNARQFYDMINLKKAWGKPK